MRNKRHNEHHFDEQLENCMSFYSSVQDKTPETMKNQNSMRLIDDDCRKPSITYDEILGDNLW